MTKKTLVHWLKKTGFVQGLVLVTFVAAVVRFAHVTELPHGLNWDEVAYGYNAISLATTGRDEWGVAWPLFLRSYGEYKPALLSYYLIPWLTLIPNATLAIRLAVATLGVLSCVGTVLLVRRISHRADLALLTGLFLAITPWHIHYSRTVMDPIISFTLLIWGWWAWFAKKTLWQLSGACVLTLAMYSYNPTRVVVPLLTITWFMVYGLSKKQWGKGRIAAVILLLLGSAWIWYQTLWGDGGTRARLVLDAPVTNPTVILDRYLKHFDPAFLFSHKPNTIQSGLGFAGAGYLLLSLAPFILLGILHSFDSTTSTQTKANWWWLAWLLIGPLASSMTVDSPHPGRALDMLPAWQWLAALGLSALFIQLKRHRHSRPYSHQRLFGASLLIATLFAVDLGYYWHTYTTWYPSESEPHFQGYYREAVTFLDSQRAAHQQLFFTNYYDSPLLFVAWYTDTAPIFVQTGERRGYQLSTITTLPRIKMLDHDQRPLCKLLESGTLLMVAPVENLLRLPPVKEFTFTAQPNQIFAPVAFQALSSEHLTPKDSERLRAWCR